MAVQKRGESKADEGRTSPETPPERWSAGRKMEVVLRLLRGEVSREVQVPASELEEWRRVFLDSGQQELKRRGRAQLRSAGRRRC